MMLGLATFFALGENSINWERNNVGVNCWSRDLCCSDRKQCCLCVRNIVAMVGVLYFTVTCMC